MLFTDITVLNWSIHVLQILNQRDNRFEHLIQIMKFSPLNALCLSVVFGITVLLETSKGQKMEQEIKTIINNRCDSSLQKRPRKSVNRSNLITISPIFTVQSNAKLDSSKFESADSNRKSACINVKISNSKKHDLLKVSVLNCRSVRNKTDSLRDIIIENKLDIFGLTETW